MKQVAVSPTCARHHRPLPLRFLSSLLFQICVMIHSGSRGLGHQVATDALTQMESAMARDSILTNDRQLACARIESEEGQNYLKGMAAAANYAWVNRSSMTFLTRQVRRVLIIPPPAGSTLSAFAAVLSAFCDSRRFDVGCVESHSNACHFPSCSFCFSFFLLFGSCLASS